MIYVYDILLNFNHDLYEFYEWEKSDIIYHIKKIPMYRVSSQFINDVMDNKIKIDDPILLEVLDKTEIFDNKRINQLPNSFLVTDTYRILAILLDSKGYVIKLSDLLLDEAIDTIDMSFKQPIKDIAYTIIKAKKNEVFLTRREVKIKKYLQDEIKKAYRAKDKNKLKYLYFEYFDEYSMEIDTIYEKLLGSLNDVIDKKHIHLYDVLKLCNQSQISHLI